MKCLTADLFEAEKDRLIKLKIEVCRKAVVIITIKIFFLLLYNFRNSKEKLLENFNMKITMKV